MKFRIIFAASLSVTFLFLIVLSATGSPLQHSFGVKEYDDFHHVLRPLQHEALPKNDVATIRARAKELIGLGEAITKLGVPEGTKPEKVTEFREGLKKFADALVKFGADAESGTDADLKKSYIAVHDSFEELAEKLPPKSSTVRTDEYETDAFPSLVSVTSEKYIRGWREGHDNKRRSGC